MVEKRLEMQNSNRNVSNILEVEHLQVHFFTRRGEIKAIRGIDLSVRKGEVLGIVGESGCGKSVTSLSLVDLLPSGTGAITDGDIIIEGNNVSDLYKKEYSILRNNRRAKVKSHQGTAKKLQPDVRRIRGKVSMIFQDPLTSLDPLYRVQTQMLESILYNNQKTIIKRVLEKDDLRKENRKLLELLPKISTAEFTEKIKDTYGDEGLYQELLLITNMNLGESDKRIRISRSINSSSDLDTKQRTQINKKLELAIQKSIRAEKKILLEQLASNGVSEFTEKMKERYGDGEPYSELNDITNMNIAESDKKSRVSNYINSSSELDEILKLKTSRELKSVEKKIKKPKDRKFEHFGETKDPIRKEAILYSLELLEFIDMPMPERALGLYPHELSGGMKQRVMIGLAIANNPHLLIADEPTTALDVTTQRQILYLLKNLNEKLDLTIIFITHDLGVMAAMADRIAVMYSGKICEVGPSNLFFTDPLHPYTRGLLKSVPVEGQSSSKLYTIPGQVPDLLNPPTGCAFADRCESVMERCRDDPPPPVDKDQRVVYCWLYGGESN